jgi:hypothetical protein
MGQDACDGLVLGQQVLLDLLGFLEHRLGILVRVFGTLVAALAWMFWPTMIIGSSTSCRNVCAIQATIMMGSWEWIAAGRLIRLSAVNR